MVNRRYDYESTYIKRDGVCGRGFSTYEPTEVTVTRTRTNDENRYADSARYRSWCNDLSTKDKIQYLTFERDRSESDYEDAKNARDAASSAQELNDLTELLDILVTYGAKDAELAQS